MHYELEKPKPADFHEVLEHMIAKVQECMLLGDWDAAHPIRLTRQRVGYSGFTLVFIGFAVFFWVARNAPFCFMRPLL